MVGLTTTLCYTNNYYIYTNKKKYTKYGKYTKSEELLSYISKKLIISETY